MADVLTPEQRGAFDLVPVEQRLRPSGDQTPAQARNLAIDSFRAACEFDGIPVPTVEAVEAALNQT